MITRDDIDLIKTRYNCHEADVDNDGDVWIADPQAGHWLSEDEKSDFETWRDAQ